MCYPNGGDEPTITDANLVLGRIPPALIGGGIALDVERARAGIAALAARLPGNMSAEQLAHGIIEIANWNQANAIRQMTIQRGIDPRGFALLSFGGAGPAQSPAVMDLLGMKACIVPPNPGNLSAFGLLAVDWRTDHIVTKVMHEDAIDLAAVAAHLCRRWSARRSTTLAARRHRALAHPADARGRHSLRRPIDGGAGRRRPAARSMRAFLAGADRRLQRRASKRTFGYNYAGQQKIELVNFCVSGFGLIERPQHAQARHARRATPAPKVQPRGLFRRRVPRHAGL